ncbi:type II toxin-antitoxin system antitoxin SocA domain-containing protein [uncultured Anaerovibrio sp.]|uniref:type II toxin-antitoxin system antitoxin SocA domain-containing protein n=1 Tax=uncultured Anaerovibrio sp. TaxID=361586 RepID=UPI0025F88469|nr:type II toxin-antitoxin system antitoxin SocA domain-containing protein [uncultured Anaerovibrio sp.]
MKALDIAIYFLRMDTNKEVFQKNLVNKNGRNFYDGNAKLNKFLHLAQNIFFAKNEKLLFEDDLYAYDNGAVIPSVLEQYARIYQNRNTIQVEDIPEDISMFLKKFFLAFKNASLEDLISLSHEDVEWESKSHYYKKPDKKMDTKKNLQQYKKQYADIIKIMDRMAIA